MNHLLQVVGPFYEFVDESVLNKFNISRPPKDSPTADSHTKRRMMEFSGSSLAELSGSSLPRDQEEEEEEDEELAPSLEEMMGQYVPHPGTFSSIVGPGKATLTNKSLKSFVQLECLCLLGISFSLVNDPSLEHWFKKTLCSVLRSKFQYNNQNKFVEFCFSCFATI